MDINYDTRIILDSLYDGILIIDKQGIVKYINPSYTRITKLNKEQLINKKLLDVRKDSYLTQIMKTGEKKIGLYRTIDNIKYVVNMVPIYDDNNSIIGGISVVNDIQDIQKTLENTLSLLNNFKEKVKIINRSKYTFDNIISVDRNSLEIKNYSKRISITDANILINGDIGTGKKIFAQAIHSYSPRANHPFIMLNCDSLDRENLEKELFGFEKGIYKEEKFKEKIGAFQLADGGTLFLNEIYELDYSLQNKLLRVLQTKSIKRIGGTKEIPVNFRLICATTRNDIDFIENEKFKKDLYYAISVIPLTLPLLKDRKDDIPVLINKFLNELSLKYKKEIFFSEKVIEILSNYSWPGNIRELKNIIEFLFNTVDGKIVTSDILPKHLKPTGKINDIKNLNSYMKEIEKKYIEDVLNNFENNLNGKKKAAELLGISLATLYNKIS